MIYGKKNMSINDKIILIFYIDVRHIDDDDLNQYLHDVSKVISNNDNIINYIMPVMSDTKVECLNPKIVTEEDFNKAKNVLDRNQEIINEFIKNKNK